MMAKQTECQYVMEIADGGGSEIVEAASLAEARKAAVDWTRDGNYGDITETIWVDVRVWRESNPDDSDMATVQINPEAPSCVDERQHDWREVRVSGHGGGVVCTDRCQHCGAEMITDTWAQRPDTGEQGLRSVKYRSADDTEE